MAESKRYILFVHGPNLNLLGTRQPEIYGTETLADINRNIVLQSSDACEYLTVQHNAEGDIIDAIHKAGTDANCVGIVLNAGAYTHYSYAIADAIASVDKPVVEVHLSNVFARDEQFRSTSVIAPVCVGSLAGFGWPGYVMAAKFLEANYM